MSNWPAYSAGSARVSIRPKLADTFRSDLRGLLAPITQSLDVTAQPKLMAGFKTALAQQVRTAANGVSAKVEATPDVRKFKSALRTDVTTAAQGVTVKVPVEAKIQGFKTDLRTKVNTAATGVKVKVPVEAKLAAGFKTSVETDARTALTGADVKVEVGAKLSATFETDLRTKIDADAKGVTGTVEFKPALTASFKTDLTTDVQAVATAIAATALEFKPSLRSGFTVDLKTLVGGVVSKLRSVTLIEFRPGLVAGFRADLRTKLNTSTGGLRPKLQVDVDVTRATAQLEAFRTAQHAIPLTLNVNIDAGSATAQLLALRALAGAINSQVSDIGNGLTGRGSQKLTGNIFTRPYRAVKLQIEVDKASVTRAQAEVANVAAKLAAARQRQTDALDKVTLAEQRHREVMARTGASESQRTSATQSLTRARRAFAAATGEVTDLMGREYDAEQRQRDAESDRASRTRLLGAAFRGLRSAIVDSLQNAAKQLFSFSTLLGIAKVALIALAAVSLVPLIGQLVQALGVVAILPASLVGLVSVFAAIKIGVTGVGDAFSAASKMAENSADDLKAQAKKIESAQKAQASAAKSVVTAQRGIVTAERGVRDAQKNSLTAQKDLTKARKDAKQEIDDLNKALGRITLNEQSAAVSVAEAYQNLYEVFSNTDSTSIDKARAQLQVKQALADQQDVLDTSRKTAEDAAAANEKGIEGSDSVVAAKDRVTAAAEAETDAQQSLSDAYDSLAEAQTNLADASKDLSDALTEPSDSVKEFEKAMGKLSPAAQDFVNKLIALKPELSDFKKAIQEDLFTGLGDSVKNLTQHWLPTLRDGLGSIADKINGALRTALADLDTDATRSKLKVIFDNVATSIGPIITGLENILQGLLSLAGVGTDLFPSMSQSFLDLSEKFRFWAESPEGKQQFKDFLDESFKKLGKIWELGKQLGSVIWQLFKGSDETGESWLDSMTATLKRWSDYLATPEGQKAMKDFFEDVRNYVKEIADSIDKVVRGIDWLERKFKLISQGANLVNDIGGVLNGDVKPLAKDIGGAAGDIWDGLQRKVEEKAPGVIVWFAKVGTSLGDLASKAKENLTGGLGGALTGLLDKLPGFSDDFKTALGGVGLNFGDLKTKVTDVLGDLTGPGGFDKLTTVFGGMVAAITGDNGIGKLKSVFSQLPDFFGGIVGGIGGKWDGLFDRLKTPLNFVIGALNSGIGGAWNSIANLLGLDKKWTDIPLIGGGGGSGSSPGNGGARTPEGRATGGPIYGPGGPTEDRVPIMASAGEHMWTAAEVQAAGGHQAMYKMRQSVLSSGGRQSKDGNYAVGGNVTFGSDADRWMADTIQNVFANATVTSALRPNETGFHRTGQAIDVTGPLQQIANWIYSAYPESTQLIYGPGPLLYNARGYHADPANQKELQGIYAGDLAGHFDHVHWANVSPLGNLSPEQKAGLFERLKGGLGSIVSGGRNLAVSSLVETPLRAMANAIPEFSGLGDFGSVPKKFASKVVDTIVDFLKGSSGGSGSVAYTPSAGVEQWRALVLKVLKAKGLPETYVDRVLMQMQSESSGNPNAQNNSDRNAAKGTPSKGLMQVIDPTFQAYKDPGYDDIWDPESNLRASLNYALKDPKYGSLEKAYTGHGYDQGGIWPNRTIGWNMSGLPEAVLTNPQWKALRDFGQGLGLLDKSTTPTPNPGVNVEGQTIPDSNQVSTDPLLSESVNSNDKVGLDTWKTLGAKTKDRFQSVWDTGLTDMIDANLGALGIDDPRNIPLYKQATAYKDTWDTWQTKKAAAAQATQALADSGYYQAGNTVTGAANQATSVTPSGQQISNDQSTTINIYPADVDEGYRKAQQIADLRSLTKIARGN